MLASECGEAENAEARLAWAGSVEAGPQHQEAAAHTVVVTRDLDPAIEAALGLPASSAPPTRPP